MSKIPILFELMETNSIKQKQLSAVIGVSQGNISDWKKGRSSPNAEVLPKIADFFSVSVDYLLGLDDVPNRKKEISAPELTGAERRLITAFKELTYDDQMTEVGRIELMAEQALKASS